MQIYVAYQNETLLGKIGKNRKKKCFLSLKKQKFTRKKPKKRFGTEFA